VAQRFLTRAQVPEELAVSESQVHALIRRRDLRAAKIGGRGVWRISRTDLESYIEQTYATTDQWINDHPFSDVEDLDAHTSDADALDLADAESVHD